MLVEKCKNVTDMFKLSFWRNKPETCDLRG
jgi:hypothetical protein